MNNIRNTCQNVSTANIVIKLFVITLENGFEVHPKGVRD